MTMSKEQELQKAEELRQALNFLANNWCHNPQLREAFEAIFEKLDTGTIEDKLHAEILRQYLSYPGSEVAQAAAISLHRSLQTDKGRAAAGLKRRGRGREVDPEQIKLEDEVMQIMIRHLMGKAKNFDVENAIKGLFMANPHAATVRKFRRALEPRAQAFVDLYKKMNTQSARNAPLWEESKPSQSGENNH
jgi:hypothetical protein